MVEYVNFVVIIIWSFNMEEIAWKPLQKGAVLAVFLGIILSFTAGNSVSFIAYALAATYVGYSVKGDNRNRAIHGALVAVIGNIVVIIITGIVSMFEGEFSSVIVQLDIIAIIGNAIIGAIAGVVGAKTKGLGWLKEVNWKQVYKGVFIAIIVVQILSLFFDLGELLAYFIIAFYVGYSVDKDSFNGARHGVLVAIISLIIVQTITELLFANLGYPGGDLNQGEEALLAGLGFVLFILDSIAAAIGGAIGATIKNFNKKP